MGVVMNLASFSFLLLPLLLLLVGVIHSMQINEHLHREGKKTQTINKQILKDSKQKDKK